MKTIILMRHGDAYFSSVDGRDERRELTSKGIKEVESTGSLLKRKELHPHQIIASTAVRAISTACLVARCLEYPESLIHQESFLYNTNYSECEVVSMLNRVSSNHSCVLIVAHNPTISKLIDVLLGNSYSRTHLSTGMAVMLSYDIAEWEDMYVTSPITVEVFNPLCSES